MKNRYILHGHVFVMNFLNGFNYCYKNQDVRKIEMLGKKLFQMLFLNGFNYCYKNQDVRKIEMLGKKTVSNAFLEWI